MNDELLSYLADYQDDSGQSWTGMAGMTTSSSCWTITVCIFLNGTILQRLTWNSNHNPRGKAVQR